MDKDLNLVVITGPDPEIEGVIYLTGDWEGKPGTGRAYFHSFNSFHYFKNKIRSPLGQK